MRKIICSLVLFFFVVVTQAQYSRHIIKFTNKTGSSGSIANPSAFLSAKSVARRTRYNIDYDSTDLPITLRYLDSLKAAGAVTILSYSK